ncbi:MAG: formylglycine-generating enzyme family protein [Roseiflexaceae bacterium]
MQAAKPPKGMAWIPGGSFAMGSDDFYPEERPVRQVVVDGFWMDIHLVTNAAFRRFVEATGYVTMAERVPNPADYPDANPALLVPGSLVFRASRGPVDLRDVRNWWIYQPGACWRHPEGPGSSLAGRERHPVVHVTQADAQAYAAWMGKTLPSEAEWERAARGGLEGLPYAWGHELAPKGRQLANTWQGEFPWQNLALDGFDGTSPVGSFPANPYGLFDMIGNTWEWTSDYFRQPLPATSPCCVPHNPRVEQPQEALPIPRMVIKGGSHLCAPNYCQRYRPAARQAEAIDTSTSHIGFRCILRPA